MKNVISCKTTSRSGVKFGLIMPVERVAMEMNEALPRASKFRPNRARFPPP